MGLSKKHPFFDIDFLGRWVYMGWDESTRKTSYLYEKSRNHWVKLAGMPSDPNLYPHIHQHPGESYDDNNDDEDDYGGDNDDHDHITMIPGLLSEY